MPLLFARHAGRDAARARRSSCWRRSGSADRSATARPSSPAARCSAWRSPARWPASPDIILADEPTGNLDSGSGRDIITIFGELHDKGHTVVLITHDPAIAARAGRVVRVEDGRIVEDRAN